MANIPEPITHIYKEIDEGKYLSVKHYELIAVRNGTNLLSDKINLSKNRNFALSMPAYWLKVRQDKKWSRCITGLFKTNIKYTYKGDVNHKKNLLVFKFSKDISTLTISYFKGYYTNDLNNVLRYIEE